MSARDGRRPATAGELIARGRDRDIAAISAACDAWFALAETFARRSRAVDAGVATIYAVDLVDLLAAARRRAA